MSSSKQQPTNPDNNQAQTSHIAGYDDYMYDASMHSSNTGPNSNAQLPQYPINTQMPQYWVSTRIPQYPVNPQIPQYSVNAHQRQADPEPVNNTAHYDEDDYMQNEIEAEIDALIGPRDNNDEDESVFSDEVQNAYDNYEKENSKYWNQPRTNDDDSSINEQDDIFEQMRECMRYMSQEYPLTNMPEPMVARMQESALNPDAHEFQPSWLVAPAPTENEAQSLTPYVLHPDGAQYGEEQ